MNNLGKAIKDKNLSRVTEILDENPKLISTICAENDQNKYGPLSWSIRCIESEEDFNQMIKIMVNLINRGASGQDICKPHYHLWDLYISDDYDGFSDPLINTLLELSMGFPLIGDEGYDPDPDRNSILKLLELGLNPDIYRDYNGFTLLMYSVDSEDSEMSDQILGLKPDLDRYNTNGYTALHLATFNQDNEMIKKLMKAGANREVKSKAKETPSDIANRSGNKVLIDIFQNSE